MRDFQNLKYNTDPLGEVVDQIHCEIDGKPTWVPATFANRDYREIRARGLAIASDKFPEHANGPGPGGPK